MRRRGPPQCGQVRTSTANTRRKSSAQVERDERDERERAEVLGAVGGLGASGPQEGDCARGEWAAAQARIEPALPPQDGAPHRVALATHTLLGDLLADAGLCEPALVEYSTAAFGRSLAGDPLDYRAQCDRTLGCVRLEALLLEMGEGAWALEAMKHVNLQRDLLEYFPVSQRLDEAARAEALTEAEVMDRILFKYDLPAEPQSGELEQDLARLAVFRAPTSDNSPQVWEAPSVGMRLVFSDEMLRVESEQPGVGTFEVAWTTREWLSRQKCFVYTAPTSDVARCVRRFADGSLYFGGVGFDADGMLLRPGEAPYVGRVLLGRPYDDVLRVVRFEANDPVEAPRHPEFGERRRFVALTAVGAYLVGEGHVQGERLIPDGPVRLSYASDEWYRAQFSFGVGEGWRRSGTVVQRSDLSRLASVDGTQVAWTDPAQWAQHLEKVKTLVAQAAREQAERDWRRQLEVWGSMDQGGGHGRELGQTVAQYPCYHCDGTGTQYKSGRMESYTYYVYDVSVRQRIASASGLDPGRRSASWHGHDTHGAERVGGALRAHPRGAGANGGEHARGRGEIRGHGRDAVCVAASVA